MPTVKDVIAHKGRVVHTVERSAHVEHAILTMVERGIGSLVVLSDGEPVGIFTERDVLRRVALAARDPRVTPVGEVMTPQPVAVGMDHSIEDCMAIMTGRRIRHLPVLEAGRLAGMLSIGDIVKYLSGQRETEMARLTEYILGKYPA
jgi:CBS domain-containing protein